MKPKGLLIAVALLAVLGGADLVVEQEAGRGRQDAGGYHRNQDPHHSRGSDSGNQDPARQRRRGRSAAATAVSGGSSQPKELAADPDAVQFAGVRADFGRPPIRPSKTKPRIFRRMA